MSHNPYIHGNALLDLPICRAILHDVPPDIAARSRFPRGLAGIPLLHPTQDIVRTYQLVKDPAAQKVLKAKLLSFFSPGGMIDWEYGSVIYHHKVPHAHGTILAV